MNRKWGQTREIQSRSETIGWQKEDAGTILSNVFPLFTFTTRRVATIYVIHKNVPCVSRVSQEVPAWTWTPQPFGAAQSRPPPPLTEAILSPKFSALPKKQTTSFGTASSANCAAVHTGTNNDVMDVTSESPNGVVLAVNHTWLNFSGASKMFR